MEGSVKSPAFKAGQAKARGRKTYDMYCGCCVCFNFKDMIDEKWADDWIENFETEYETYWKPEEKYHGN